MSIVLGSSWIYYFARRSFGQMYEYENIFSIISFFFFGHFRNCMRRFMLASFSACMQKNVFFGHFDRNGLTFCGHLLI